MINSFKIPTQEVLNELNSDEIIYVKNNDDITLGILFYTTDDTWYFLNSHKLDMENYYDSISQALIDNDIIEGYLDIVKINKV